MTLRYKISAITAFAIIIAFVSSAVAGTAHDDTGDRSMTGISPDVTRELGIRAEKQSEQLVIPENRHEEWAKEKAAEFTAIYNSPEFQKRVEDETERLKRSIFNKPIEEYYPDSQIARSSRDRGESHLSKNERIYVFVSSSIPIETLRTYATAIDKTQDPNIVMVMRGFLNGMDDINSTMNFVSRVLLKDPTCDGRNCPMFRANLEIDPLLFRRYKIEEVPSIVYASNVQLVTPGGSEGIEGNASVDRFYKITGDAALDYHLDVINKEVHEKSLSALAETMRKGFYQ
jgi:conjugal transfer pilus assembly protein TrbC